MIQFVAFIQGFSTQATLIILHHGKCTYHIHTLHDSLKCTVTYGHRRLLRDTYWKSRCDIRYAAFATQYHLCTSLLVFVRV